MAFTWGFGKLLMIVILCFSILNMVVGSKLVMADSINEGVFAIDSKPYGISFEDWTIKFWQWLLSIPVSKNPAVDQTGEFCGEAQGNDQVFFLVFSGSGGADRTCSVPAGKAILIPVNVAMCSYAEFPGATEEELHTCATEDESSNPGLFLSVDGVAFKDLEKYRVHSRAFNFSLPSDPWLGDSGPSRGVSDGYWIILEPLPPGKHEIEFRASLSNPTTGILFYSDNLKYVVNAG